MLNFQHTDVPRSYIHESKLVINIKNTITVYFSRKITIVNENLNNFLRSFHWMVYGIIEFFNDVIYDFNPIQKSMTCDCNKNFYGHSIWIFRYFAGIKTIVNSVKKSNFSHLTLSWQILFQSVYIIYLKISHNLVI